MFVKIFADAKAENKIKEEKMISKIKNNFALIKRSLLLTLDQVMKATPNDLEHNCVTLHLYRPLLAC